VRVSDLSRICNHIDGQAAYDEQEYQESSATTAFEIHQIYILVNFRRSVPAICSGFKVFLSFNLSAVSITLLIELGEVNL
jgi:hypothetical protein